MNRSIGADPLISLWHTAPKPDPQQILRDLQRFERSRQRMNWILIAVLCTVSCLLLFAETRGGMGTRGILSAIWIPAVVLGVVWLRRERCNRITELGQDTTSLLKRVRERARTDLFIARCLYAGVPCGALAGALIARALSGPTSPTGVHVLLKVATAIAGLVILIAMMVFGVILERSRRQQIKSLSATLESLTVDL